MAASRNYRLLARSIAAAAGAAAISAPALAATSSASHRSPAPAPMRVRVQTQTQSRTQASVRAGSADPTGLVDTFTGTSGGGDTFPGATVPFGMTQPSPDTPSRPSGGGYAYKDKKIQGFSAVHVSGPGCPALGHLSVMPVTGPVASTDDTKYASAFSHATEAASPGYYGVTLTRYGIRAEMSATARSAWERYTFPANDPTRDEVLLNLGAAENKTTGARLDVTGPDTVTGQQSTQVFCNPGYRPVTVYFAARFSRPFSATGTWNGGGVSWGSTSARGAAIGGAFRFEGGDRKVTVSIGVSYTSAANAAANLAAETPASGGFDAVANQAHATWRQWLDRIAVTGGTRQQRATFYTALYHSLIEPNLFSDVNGQYFGMDGKVHTAANRAEYTNLSLWDTYRTQQELLDLVAPQVAHDVVMSIVSDSQELGWVPRWVLANEETNTMSGDSVTEMIADALASGVVTKDEVSPVYPYLKDNATQPPPPGSQATGRAGITDYRQKGYVPFTLSGQYFQLSAASSTLEYALADCGLSHIAASLGNSDDAADFASTAHDYRDEFDSSTGFFRPRLSDGSYMSPFHPSFVSLPYVAADAAGFDEGSAWQYLWLVPQDPADLARLLGGTGAAIRDLDRFFAFPDVAADPSSAVSEWTNGGRYDVGNEVDFQAPYTYDALGAPWRTQAVVRAALTVYRTAPGGLPGNDDLGEMSSWYVMSALGLYPYAAGQGVFALSAPLFDRAVLSAPGTDSGPLVIANPGGGRYIHGLTVNGQPSDAAWISGSRLAGGTLEYRTTAMPDPGWASGSDGTFPAFCGG